MLNILNNNERPIVPCMGGTARRLVICKYESYLGCSNYGLYDLNADVLTRP